MSAFAGAERERHADEVAMADIATTIQFGVSSGTVDATRGQLKEKVAAFGARKNWSTEQVERAQGSTSPRCTWRRSTSSRQWRRLRTLQRTPTRSTSGNRVICARLSSAISRSTKPKARQEQKRLPAKQKSVYWILPGAYTLKGSPCHLL